MKRWHKTLLLGIVEIGLILLLHQLLMRQMAERQIVAQILAAGEQASTGTLCLAGLFVLVRLLAVLCLPGMLLVRAAGTLWDVFSADRKKHT